jgi:hypothetical protein
MLKGFFGFHRGPTRQDAFHTDVFVQLRPMDAQTITDKLVILPFVGRALFKPGIPA